MTSTSYERGRAAEYKCQHELETDGYTAMRASGSHGAADVIAWNTDHIRFIQVKTFIARAGNYKADLAKLAAMPVPPNATRELWIKKKGEQGWHGHIVLPNEVPHG